MIAGRTGEQCDASVRLQQGQGSQRDEGTDRHRDQGAADVLRLAYDADADHQAEDHQDRQDQGDDGVPAPELIERDEQACTETSLVPQFVDLFNATKGLVLVNCSGQNIDRLVTVFKAARKARRTFIMDGYTAHILKSTENPKLPQSHWDGVRVFWPLNLRVKIKKAERFDLIDDLQGQRIYPEEIASIAGKAVMLFRTVMGRDLGGRNIASLEGASLIYSLWPGYLDRPDGLKLQAWLKQHDIPLHKCHTSGHASPEDLKRLARAIAPRILVPIHCTCPEEFAGVFENVQPRKDGQTWEI